MRSSNLSAALARSLGPFEALAERIARQLAARNVGWEALEASVRFPDAAASTGGRMVLEHLAPADARELLSSAIELPPLADALLEAARREHLPVIAGWDVAHEPTWKLYLNASDASVRLRAHLRRELVPSTTRGGPHAPHVIGLNLRQSRVEVKLYEQSSAPFSDAPSRFRDWAASNPVSGFVRSFRVDTDEARPKAWFAGLQSGARPELPPLPGFADALARFAPFEIGRIMFIGIAASCDQWTVYFKPAGHGAAQWSLDPFACFSDGHCEVGVYLEPNTIAQRAYARTAHWAISYRMRDGRTDGKAIDQLMRWFLAQVAAHESPPTNLTAPPEPWHVVD